MRSEPPQDTAETPSAAQPSQLTRRTVWGREIHRFDEVLLLASGIAVSMAVILYVIGELPVLASILIGLAIGVGPLVIHGIEERHGHIERSHNQLQQEAGRHAELMRENSILRVEVSRLEEVQSSLQRIVEDREERDRLVASLEADRAYYLGFATTQLPNIEFKTATTNVDILRELCGELQLPLVPAERELLDQTHWVPGEIDRIAEILMQRTRGMSSTLACYSQLGSIVASLTLITETIANTDDYVRELTAMCNGPFLRLEQRYFDLARMLIDAIEPYRVAILDEERVALAARIDEVRRAAPPIYLHGSAIKVPFRITKWIRAQDTPSSVALVCMAGTRSIVTRGDDIYTVGTIGDDGSQVNPVIIAKTTAGWTCSLHEDATEDEQCSDISLVLAATKGGVAPTEELAAYVMLPPEITDVKPRSGVPGDTIIIRGDHLSEASRVAIGEASISEFEASPTEIRFVIPLDAQSAPVIVETPGGSAESEKSVRVKKGGRGPIEE